MKVEMRQAIPTLVGRLRRGYRQSPRAWRGRHGTVPGSYVCVVYCRIDERLHAVWLGHQRPGPGWRRHAAVRDEPVPAVVNPGWSTIEAGPAHTCAIDASRRLFCWGSGSQAQLGLGDTFPFAQTTPHQVETATDWLTVSAGGFSGALSPEEEDPRGSTCGIRAPGALYCWGIGAIGSGAAFADHPTQVGTATDWTQVSVGGFHACGIRTGALYCWGRNTFGQLGDGTTTDHNEPVRVGPATDWTAVTASPTAHTCGIRAGGLYCWGNNSTGQLGDGTTTNRVVPTRVGMQADWTSVTAGGFGDISQMPNEFPGHTCGIRGARANSRVGVRTDKASSGSARHADERPQSGSHRIIVVLGVRRGPAQCAIRSATTCSAGARTCSTTRSLIPMAIRRFPHEGHPSAAGPRRVGRPQRVLRARRLN